MECDQTKRQLVVDVERCTGCRVCELACSLTKLGECNPKAAHIKVMTNEEMAMVIPALRSGCDLCGECVAWCAPEALEIVSWQEAASIRSNLRIGKLPAVLIS